MICLLFQGCRWTPSKFMPGLWHNSHQSVCSYSRDAISKAYQ